MTYKVRGPLLALAFGGALLGLLHGSRCYPSHDAPERLFVAVSAMFTRCVDELLTLGLAARGGLLALWHVASCEVCHG